MKEEKNEKLNTIAYTLSNGAFVTIKPTEFKNDEVVMYSYRSGGSSLYEGADYQSATYSNNVVEEMGYGNFSNTDLTKFLSGKKVSVMPVVDDYAEYIMASSNVKDIETMFELLYLKCTAPRKDETAFASYKSREKQQLELMMQNPQFSFMEKVMGDLYQNHPRAHVSAVPEDFDNINIAHAIDYYKQRLGNMNGMHFFVAGNVKPDIVKQSTFILGDDNRDRQYISILQFSTASLPDNAVVTKVTPMVRSQSYMGTNPFTTHQNIAVDIRKGYFGSSGVLGVNSLDRGDFQAPASLSNARVILNNPVIDWYWAMLDPAASQFINLTGVTEFRLRFQLPDNTDRGNDWIRFYSGNYYSPASHPMLQIEYYMP